MKPHGRGTGRKLLKRFLDQHRISVRRAAREIGVSHVTILNWLSGELVPSQPHRAAIEKWTAEALPAASWETADERAVVERVQPFTGALSTGEGA